MLPWRRSALRAAIGIGVNVVLASASALAQSEAPPPPAAAEPPPAAAEPAPAATAESSAAFPLDAAPPAAAPADATASAPPPLAGGNPKLKRLPNRARPAVEEPAPAAAPAAGWQPGAAPGQPPPGAPMPNAAGPQPRDNGPLGDPPEYTGRKQRQWGVMLDLGVPDGVMASALYRPIRWARVNAGLGFNAVSPGIRIGGALVPFGTGPFAGVDFGHYFGGDANGLARTVAGDHEDNLLLKDVGYDYVNLRLGLELGGERFVFIMKGGVSYLWTTIHHVDDLIDSNAAANSQTSVSLSEDPVLTAWTPSLDLGAAFFF